jgi:hypothetical protein
MRVSPTKPSGATPSCSAASRPSFTREAREALEAYRDALTTSTPDAWTHFVETADALARHTESVASVVPLSPNERQAYAFFEQIAGENADLFQSQTPAPV